MPLEAIVYPDKRGAHGQNAARKRAKKDEKKKKNDSRLVVQIMSFSDTNDKEFQALVDSFNLLDKQNSINLTTYSLLLQTLPNWLVSKLRLIPNTYLSSKLTCLHYQLDEFLHNGAVDIEDHYLNTGISQADLTYGTEGAYTFVDVTTSKSPDIIKKKKAEIQLAAGDQKTSVYIISVLSKIFVMDENEIHPVDELDIFNMILVKTQPDLLDRLTSEIKKVIIPTIKNVIHELAINETTVKLPDTELTVPYNEHSSTWVFPKLFDDIFDELTSKITCDISQPQLEVIPSSKKINSFPSLSQIYNEIDPLVIAGLIASSVPLKPHTLYKIIIGQSADEWVTEDLVDVRGSSNYFKVKGKESKARREISTCEVPMIYLSISDSIVTSATGLSYPKYFNAVSSNHWSTYGYYHMNNIPKHKVNTSSKLTREIIREAQFKHERLVEFLSSYDEKLDAELISQLALVTDKLGDKQFTAVALGGLENDINNMRKNVMINYVSQLSSIARTICQTSPVNGHPYMYRIAQTTDMYHLLFVSMSKPIEKVTDVAYAAWCPSPIVTTCSDRHCKAKTVSSRKLVWWHKLSYAIIVKACALSQSNMSVHKKPYYNMRDLCEFSSFHLDTRQQDSILQDQTRYIYVAVMSPIPDKFGSLKKIDTIRLKGCESVIYYSRLVAMHTNIYLRKAGMRPKILLRHGDSPKIPFPSMTKPTLNMNDFVDSLFESRVFNKFKDNTLAAEAEDWVALLENEVDYKKAIAINPLETMGCSKQFLLLIAQVIKKGNISPLIEDLRSKISIWKDEIEVYWKTSPYIRGDGFSWSAASLYAIMIANTTGRRFSDMSDDYASPLAQLLDTPISDFLSSSGATLGFEATADLQNCRKPTAILEIMSKIRGLSSEPRMFGIDVLSDTASFMDRHTSALSVSTWLMLQKQGLSLVSKTVDKDQPAGYREFSPMNGVGIISCRATELPMSSLMSNFYPTDKMNDKDVETTMVDQIKSMSDTSNLYVAADCSRFGPKQIMPSLRAAIACLCLSGRHYDEVEQLFYYNLLAESTRLMGSKQTKMPPNLYRFFKNLGGYTEAYKKDPNSVYGRIAKMSLIDLHWDFVSPYFKQEWGMLQGTISMVSSVKSSCMHDLVTEIIGERCGLPSVAMVTNDDSLVAVQGLPPDNIKEFSKYIVSLIQHALPIAGQKLNPFKTVASTLLAEFHSMFADPNGLIIPSYKKCLAALDIGTGENIIDDMRMPTKVGVSLLRDGASLQMATFTSYISTCMIASQYSRFKYISQKGAGLTILGQMPSIKLVSEVILPNSSDFDILKNIGKDSHLVMAAQQFLLEDQNYVTYKSVGFRKLSRQGFREAKHRIETGWVSCNLALPIFKSTTAVSLCEAMENGVFKSTTSNLKDHYLTRLAKGLTSSNVANVSLPEGSITHLITGKLKLSDEELSSIKPEEILRASLKIIKDNPAISSLSRYYELLQRVHGQLHNLPSPFSLPWGDSNNASSTTVYRPVHIKSYLSTRKYPGFERMVESYGSPLMKLLVSDQIQGYYHYDLVQKLQPEIKNLVIAGSLVNRITHASSGKFLLPVEFSSKIATTRDLVESLYKNTLTNVHFNTKKLLPILSDIQTHLPSAYESAPSVLLNLPNTILSDNVEDIQSLFDILRSSPRGYFWASKDVKVKVSRAIFNTRGRSYKDTYIVTTKYPRDKINQGLASLGIPQNTALPYLRSEFVYIHFVLTTALKLHTGDIENLASYNLAGKLMSAGESYAPSPSDLVIFPTLTSLFPFVKVQAIGSVNLVSKHIAIPYERVPLPTIGYTEILPEGPGTLTNTIYVLSNGLIDSKSERMKMIQERASMSPDTVCEVIAEEYYLRDLYQGLLSGNIPILDGIVSSTVQLKQAAAFLRGIITEDIEQTHLNLDELDYDKLFFEDNDKEVVLDENDLTNLMLIEQLHTELLEETDAYSSINWDKLIDQQLRVTSVDV